MPEKPQDQDDPTPSLPATKGLYVSRIMKDRATGRTIQGVHREAAMIAANIPIADDMILWVDLPTENNKG